MFNPSARTDRLDYQRVNTGTANPASQAGAEAGLPAVATLTAAGGIVDVAAQYEIGAERLVAALLPVPTWQAPLDVGAGGTNTLLALRVRARELYGASGGGASTAATAACDAVVQWSGGGGADPAASDYASDVAFVVDAINAALATATAGVAAYMAIHRGYTPPLVAPVLQYAPGNAFLKIYYPSNVGPVATTPTGATTTATYVTWLSDGAAIARPAYSGPAVDETSTLSLSILLNEAAAALLACLPTQRETPEIGFADWTPALPVGARVDGPPRVRVRTRAGLPTANRYFLGPVVAGYPPPSALVTETVDASVGASVVLTTLTRAPGAPYTRVRVYIPISTQPMPPSPLEDGDLYDTFIKSEAQWASTTLPFLLEDTGVLSAYTVADSGESATGPWGPGTATSAVNAFGPVSVTAGSAVDNYLRVTAVTPNFYFAGSGDDGLTQAIVVKDGVELGGYTTFDPTSLPFTLPGAWPAGSGYAVRVRVTAFRGNGLTGPWTVGTSTTFSVAGVSGPPSGVINPVALASPATGELRNVDAVAAASGPPVASWTLGVWANGVRVTPDVTYTGATIAVGTLFASSLASNGFAHTLQGIATNILGSVAISSSGGGFGSVLITPASPAALSVSTAIGDLTLLAFSPPAGAVQYRATVYTSAGASVPGTTSPQYFTNAGAPGVSFAIAGTGAYYLTVEAAAYTGTGGAWSTPPRASSTVGITGSLTMAPLVADTPSGGTLRQNGAITTVSGTATQYNLIRAYDASGTQVGTGYSYVGASVPADTFTWPRLAAGDYYFRAQAQNAAGGLSAVAQSNTVTVAAGGFNPTSIADCEIWLDASDAGTMSLTGSVVNSITSKGAVTATFSSVTGSSGSPLTVATIQTTNDAIAFPAGGGRGLFGLQTFSGSSATVFFMMSGYNAASSGAFARLFSMYTTTGNDYDRSTSFTTVLPSAGPNLTVWNNFQQGGSTPLPQATRQVVVLRITGTSATISIVGATTTGHSISTMSGTYSTTRTTVGCDNAFLSSVCCSVGQYVMYSRALTTSSGGEVDQVVAWLQGKYAF